MTIERIFLCLLKSLDRNLCADIEEVAREANLPIDMVSTLLEGLHSISYSQAGSEVYVEDRVKLAQELMSLGVELERILYSLNWKDVEDFVSEILMRHGFATQRNFRFRIKSKRYEVDVLAKKGNVGLSIDCKRMKRMPLSTIKRIVEKHLIRTKALAKYIERKNRIFCDVKVLLPLIVITPTLDIRYHRNVPVVPVRKLNDFLLNFAGYLDEFEVFKIPD